MRNNGIVWGLIVLGVLLLLGLIGGVQLNNSIAAVDQRSKALEARVDEASGEEALAALQRRQDELEARLAALVPSDLTPLETAVGELRAGLAALETKVGEQTTAAGIEALTVRIDALEGELADVPPPVDIAPVTASVDVLRRDVDGLTAQIGDLTPATVTDLAGRVAATESAVAGIAPTDLAPLTNEVAGLTTRVDQAEANIAAISFPSLQPIEDRLAELDGRVGAIQPVDLAPIETEIASIRTNLTSLRTDLDGKASPADIAAVAEQLTAIDARIDALPAVDVEPIRVQVAALETSLAGVRDAITQLQSAPAAPAPSLVALESIYFAPASTSIGDERGKIDALAARLGPDAGMLSIVGFSDSSGPAELNRALSLRRAAAVRLALIEGGVSPQSVTSVTGLGEDAPPVTTGDDTDEAGNRVVVIYGRQ